MSDLSFLWIERERFILKTRVIKKCRKNLLKGVGKCL